MMKIALLGHLAGQPHLHRTDVAVVIALVALAAFAYFLTRRVRR